MCDYEFEFYIIIHGFPLSSDPQIVKIANYLNDEYYAMTVKFY